MVHLFRFKTHIQNPINNTFTYSYTFQSLKRLFILVFISSRISSLVCFAFFRSFFLLYAPGSLFLLPPVCCVCHIIVSCSPDCCFVFRFFPFTFFPPFQNETTSDKSTLYIHGRSILSRIFITVRLFFLERIFLSKVNSFFFGGSFCGNLFLFLPLVSISFSFSPSDNLDSNKRNESLQVQVVPLLVMLRSCIRHKTIFNRFISCEKLFESFFSDFTFFL